MTRSAAAAALLAALVAAPLAARAQPTIDGRSGNTPLDLGGGDPRRGAEVAAVRARRGRSEESARRRSFSRAWRERPVPWGAWTMDAGVRGFALDGRRFRPGLDQMPTGWTWWPRLFRGADSDLALHVEDEVRIAFDNVDRDALLGSGEWPGTIPEDLAGGEGGVTNFALADASYALVPGALWVAAEAIDQRTFDRVPLGTTQNETHSRPRYTLDVTWRPDDRLELRVGGRYEAIEVSNQGLSSWHRPSAARDRRIDEATLALGLRWSIEPRQELAATFDLVHFREDVVSRGGILAPGHDNLDTFEVWGNNPWTLRQRRTTERIDLRWSVFADGVFAREDAHTITVGVSLEHLDAEDDDTRNGGFTFRDAGTCPQADCGNRESFLRVDEQDRTSWQLLTSDRGDELHAHTDVLSLAAWLEDAWELDSWLRITAGLRVQHDEGGFDRVRGVLSALTVAPRVQAVVDLTPDHLTSLFFQYGRHYHALTPQMLHRARDGAAYSPLEYWDWTGDPGAPLPIGIDDPRWSRSAGLPAVLGRVEDGTRLPYVDRLVGGITFGLDDLGLRAALRYEYRRQGDMLAVHDASFGQGNYVLVSDERARFGPGPNDVAPYYDLREAGSQDYVLGNAPGAWRETHVVDLMASSPITDFLEVAARVTFTEDRGNLDARDGVSLEWRDPSGTLGSTGRMPGYRPWRLWLGAVIDLPANISVWVDYRFFAGSYYSRTQRVQPLDNQRVFVWDAAGRGAYQLPDQHQLDVRVQVRIDDVRLWAAGLNLLNLGAVSGVREVASSFRSITALQPPIELRVGASYDY